MNFAIDLKRGQVIPKKVFISVLFLENEALFDKRKSRYACTVRKRSELNHLP